MNILILKNPTSPKPYTVIYDGYLQEHFASLRNARRSIHRTYARHKDPTRFFVCPSKGLARHRRSLIKSLDLIAIDILAEARFIEFIKSLILENGPQPVDPALAKASRTLDISSHTAIRFLMRNCYSGADFHIAEQRIFLPR